MAKVRKLLHLRSHRFDTDVRTFWQELQADNDFCDVTIACEEKLFKTHKLLISALSPVMRKILKLYQNPHPLIYLKGVKYKDLQNLLHFMYQGEVNITEEDLPAFLEVAEDLQIVGISNEIKVEGEANPDEVFETFPQTNAPQRKSTFVKNLKSNVSVSIKNQSDFNKTEINEDNESLEDESNPDELLENFSETNAIDNDDKNNVSISIKSQSDINKTKTNEHIESFVVTGEKPFMCGKCFKPFSDRRGLFRHNESVHEEIRYSCDLCTHKATQKRSLRAHKRQVHEGVRYPCKYCEYKATQSSSLHRHVSRHHTAK